MQMLGHHTRRHETGAPTGRRRGPLAAGMLAAVAAVCLVASAGGTSALGDVGATPPPDALSATMTTPGTVLAGVAASYTITVANTTTAAIPNVSAEFQLPSGMSLKAVPANCVKALFGGNSGPASCSLGTLAPGASASVTVSIVATSAGTFTIQGAALAQVPLPGSGFQILSTNLGFTVQVAPGPTDVQVTGSSNNGSPPVGSAFSYTFQVKDNGPQGASGVTFDDTLPATIGLTSFSTSVGTCVGGASPNSVHCELGDLAVGQQATIVITAVATATGAATNTATTGMTGPDTQPANNSVGVTVQPR
jgi:uncharacterized repeat protein (TIGR01451 family)